VIRREGELTSVTAGCLSKCSEQGFTLIELIVVMVLISLTAAFAVPQISSALFGDDLNASVRRFVGLIAETGQEARLRRIAIALRYDRERHLFTVTSAEISGGADDEGGEKHASELRLDESVQVTDITAAHGGNAEDMTILFDAHGYVDKTAVHFRHEDGEERTVLLSPFLGVTRMLDHRVSLDEDRIVLNKE
jgi:general secretion pathway protein H